MGLFNLFNRKKAVVLNNDKKETANNMDKKTFQKIIKDFLFSVGFVKTKSTVNFVAKSKDGEFRVVLNLQHSQWSPYYYVNYGVVFNKEIPSEELNYDKMEGCFPSRLKNKAGDYVEMSYDDVEREYISAIKEQVMPYVNGGRLYLQEQIMKNVYHGLYNVKLLTELGYTLPKLPERKPVILTEEQKEMRGQAEWQKGSNAFIVLYGNQKFEGFSGVCQILREHYKDNKEQWDEFVKRNEFRLAFFRNKKQQ